MRGPSRSVCHRHRDALLEFADHRDVSAVDVGSLVHLDRCGECRAEVEAEALTIVALRRLGADAARREQRADSWSRLRARLSDRPAPWRWRAPLAGLVVSAGLVAIILAPAAYLRPPAPYIQEVGLEASIFDAQRAAEDRSEALVLLQQKAARTVPVPNAAPVAPAGSVDATWYGPDGLRTQRQPAAPVAVVLRHE